MKRYFPLLFASSLALVSCDKIKSTMVSKIEEQAKLAPIPPYDGPLVTQLNEGNYESFVATRDRLVVIDFYADWCGPCRQLSPVLESIVQDHGSRMLVGKLDIEQHKKMAQKYGVQGIPDVRIFLNGEQIDGFKGFGNEAAVRQQLEQHLVNVPPIIDKDALEELSGPKQEIRDSLESPAEPGGGDKLPPGLKPR